MKKGLRAFLIILCALAVLAALGGSESALSVWQAVGSIVALLHDGHTWVDCLDTENELYIHDFSQLYEYATPVKIYGVTLTFNTPHGQHDKDHAF